LTPVPAPSVISYDNIEGSGEVRKTPTAPTAITSEKEKAPQHGSFPGGRFAVGICRGAR
jgi:hypothetical protein